MKFCALTTFSCLGTVSGAGVRVESPLEGWARRYGLNVREAGRELVVWGQLTPGLSAKGFQDLAQLSETPMRAEGNRLSGDCGGRRFEVVVL